MKAIIKHDAKGNLKNTNSISMEMEVNNIRGFFTPVPVNIDFSDVKQVLITRIKPLALTANTDINYVVLPSFQGSVKLLVADILYIRVIKNRVYIYMRDKRRLDFLMTLEALWALLLSGKFCMVCKSYLVNISEINEIEYFRDGCAIVSNSARVKIGRPYLKLLISAFILQ